MCPLRGARTDKRVAQKGTGAGRCSGSRAILLSWIGFHKVGEVLVNGVRTGVAALAGSLCQSGCVSALRVRIGARRRAAVCWQSRRARQRARSGRHGLREAEKRFGIKAHTQIRHWRGSARKEASVSRLKHHSELVPSTASRCYLIIIRQTYYWSC